LFKFTQRPNYACFEIEPLFYSKLWWDSWTAMVYLLVLRVDLVLYSDRTVPSVYSRRSLFYSKLHEILKLPWCIYWYFVSCSGSDRSMLSVDSRRSLFSIWNSMRFLNCLGLLLRVLFWLGPNYARWFETDFFSNLKLYNYEILELNGLFLRLQLQSEVWDRLKILKRGGHYQCREL